MIVLWTLGYIASMGMMLLMSLKRKPPTRVKSKVRGNNPKRIKAIRATAEVSIKASKSPTQTFKEDGGHGT